MFSFGCGLLELVLWVYLFQREKKLPWYGFPKDEGFLQPGKFPLKFTASYAIYAWLWWKRYNDNFVKLACSVVWVFATLFALCCHINLIFNPCVIPFFILNVLRLHSVQAVYFSATILHISFKFLLMICKRCMFVYKCWNTQIPSFRFNGESIVLQPKEG